MSEPDTHMSHDTTSQILPVDLTRAPKVLLIDDDELVLERLRLLVVAAGFEVETAADGPSALALLERRFNPIVIMDREMPGMDGLSLCRALRQKSWPGYIYILLLTVHDSEADILAGLEAGADDYLSKRSSSAQLLARLRTARRILNLEHSLKKAVEEKRQQSLTDALTGIPNRRHFMRQMRRDLDAAQDAGRALSLLSLDVDHFKRINDRHGHGTGDAVLREFTRRMASCLRPSDWCARMGGEEFTVVLVDTPLALASEMAEKIRRCIADAPVLAHTSSVPLTVSIGVSGWQPGMSLRETVESLLQQSDKNLYLSKERGRDRVTLPEVCEPQSPAAARAALRTLLYVDDEADIRQIVAMALGLDAQLRVHTAGSGEAALTLARQVRPDLVLLDVMMPGLDGPETLARMQQDPLLAHTPVVFMTAKTLPQELTRFRQLGALGVIAKPFDPMQLAQQVQALWERSAGDYHE